MTGSKEMRFRGKSTGVRDRLPASGQGRSLGISARDTPQMIRQVERGFPYAAILRLHEASGLPLPRISELVSIPQRTLMRRKAAGKLNRDESERLLRISGVFEQAVNLFHGDVESARLWLSRPARALDGSTPLEFARTNIGAREVEDLIGRLIHGVFT
jgi:putative toxin-antitoxin system antitoxin component (TIGR02293 family)